MDDGNSHVLKHVNAVLRLGVCSSIGKRHDTCPLECEDLGWGWRILGCMFCG